MKAGFQELFTCALIVLSTVFCAFPIEAVAQYTGAGQNVVVVDSGTMLDDTQTINKTISQYCTSVQDEITPDSTNATDGYVHYDRASTCSLGAVTSSASATVPRKTEHNFSAIYNFHDFGSPHGSYVSKQIRDFAPASSIIAINNSFYSASSMLDANTSCDYHSASDVKADLPTNFQNCYPHINPFTDPQFVSQILSTSNIAAVNISIGANLPCTTSSSHINNIVASGVPIVSASGNSGTGTNVTWPACHPSVISVGAGTLAGGGSVSSYTSDNGIIDFLAFGETINYDSTFAVGTSYASPIVSAAFALMRQASPLATIAEMKYALTKAATDAGKLIAHNGRNIPFVDQSVANAAAQCLSTGQCLVDNDSGAFDAVAYSDNGQYGSAYGDTESTNYAFELDFDNLGINIPSGKFNGASTQVQGKTVTVPLVRDVVLSFDGLVPGASNGFRIYVNGTYTFLSTGTFLNAQSFEYTLHRDLFSAGSNTILIEPIFSSRDWGLSNINAEFKPLVELTLGVTDTSTYGSEEDPERPTSLRATFTVPNVDNDVDFAVIGSKISDATEIAVYLNGIEYGHLSVDTDVTGANDGNVFSFDKADLIEGANIIELVQREGISTANAAWSVRNMLVVQSNSSSPTLALGVTDNTQYGRNYGTNEHTFTLNVSFTPETEHDHKISWRAFDIEQSGDLEVFLNNTKIKNVNTTSNNSLGATETVTLAWRLFNPGTNTLSFRSKVEGTDNTWGVTGIKVDTSPIIDLEDENNLDTDFGYFTKYSGGVPAGWTRIWSTQDYQSRLFATFDSNASSDETITVTGWDIDAPQEMAVYVNGVFLQYLSDANSSSVYSPIDVMTVPQAHLISGVNTLSFRYEGALSGFQDEKWGVLFGEARTANVVPIIMLLLDDEQTPP